MQNPANGLKTLDNRPLAGYLHLTPAVPPFNVEVGSRKTRQYRALAVRIKSPRRPQMTRQYHRFLSLTHTLSFVALILTIFAVTRSSAQDGVDPNAQGACTGSSPCVPTYHNDNNRDGVQNNEGQLSPSLFNATNQSASNFGLLGATPTSGAGVLDGLVYAQPLYLSGVAMYNNTDTPNCPVSGNPYNLLLVATQNNSIYAYTYT